MSVFLVYRSGLVLSYIRSATGWKIMNCFVLDRFTFRPYSYFLNLSCVPSPSSRRTSFLDMNNAYKNHCHIGSGRPWPHNDGGSCVYEYQDLSDVASIPKIVIQPRTLGENRLAFALRLASIRFEDTSPLGNTRRVFCKPSTASRTKIRNHMSHYGRVYYQSMDSHGDTPHEGCRDPPSPTKLPRGQK
jgi:hypothetical protein